MTTKLFSRIIAGTMTWGEWGKQLSKKEMINLLNYYVSKGITSFDHADIYGGYTTEAAFGNAFAESNIAREKIQFISKCGIQYVCENRNNKVKHYNYSKEYIIWSVEESLKNLKTDFLDLLLLHRPSPLMHADEVAEAVTILNSQGKIKAFGVSNFSTSQVDLISKYTEVAVNQIEFSLTQHRAMQNGSLDQMQINNITPMAWSPLGSVFKEDTEQTRRIHKQLGALIEKYNATEDQLLLAWILKHPAGIHPVIGTTNQKRIENAVKAINIELELEDWFKILVACQGHKVP
ncbi:aldo/keto reductase [Lacinutrix sp. C3R15]|uniref:aldo/keto reductase n=1 Tax=Flavobacteriaceae TaxID=49546 RepID=UPI001C08329D|nr:MULTISPECIES: aldo/keto reductase [Flavobacteriaceae]MBU2940981.1 aldo/keto reductase [Lacinutrix sp. C3R15]MDO6624300.1 aldo/keto reductase [Oceanihabitans sp. 1_MG-2023]